MQNLHATQKQQQQQTTAAVLKKKHFAGEKIKSIKETVQTVNLFYLCR